ncbi:MAG TPA: transporter substrate-binding domain-containing protein [Selenomonadales bacterium]|nr:transporter substrate-binding domain-containing protein [Selenomonadales bacterium]
MKKKTICFFLAAGLLLLWLLNQYIQNAYDINLFQYVSYSRGLSAEEREWLSRHGPIIYGADKSTPPLRYQDDENQQYKGIVIDYVNSLSIELGVEIKLRPLVWQDALANLEAGKTDMCDMFPSEQRARKYLFSNSIYNLRGIILKQADDDRLNGLADLAGKKVAAARGDYSVEFLSARVANIDFRYTDDVLTAIQLLHGGAVDAVVGDEPVVSFYAEKLGWKDSLRIVDKPLYEQNVILAVPKTKPQLVAILNKGIFAIKQKSVLEKIQQKWFGISAPILQQQVSKTTFILAAVLSILAMMILFLLYIANEKLKNEVSKRTEELYLSRDDLQKTFDGIPYFMVVFDRDLTIMNVNKAFSLYIGLPAAAITGKNWRELGGLGRDEALQTWILQTFSGRSEQSGELRHGGSVFQVNTFPLLDKERKVIKVVAAIQDVTELRISQKQFLQESKMAAVGQLAAGVAHEIRNPLGLIRSYIYILREEVGREKDNARKAIAVVEDSVERASGIIDNLLAFSRISGDSLERVDVGRLIKNILILEQKILQKQKIAVEYHGSPDVVCVMNQESLKHVLINLIANAIDAMPAGGTLTIRCELREFLHFVVADSGVGIPSEHLDSIFHPFFTTKPPGKGTGLGLYIAYNEVQKLGGEIRVASEPGKGTSFEVMLPLVKESLHEK